ncbi:hypothetical protein [Fulvivirga ligni]|uniref:hypothetical protein n=1 Tax=Fulvivirga ligni TaxID=2904246 RepID=UPI001F239150|nr:hypothetical protein [Fulvivirga ligni]UII22844.1 hypothetical protein LVD16_06365 [Fulvivirga ligni]
MNSNHLLHDFKLYKGRRINEYLKDFSDNIQLLVEGIEGLFGIFNETSEPYQWTVFGMGGAFKIEESL